MSLQCDVLGSSDMCEEEMAYHESRAQICRYLSSWFPLGSEGEHRTIAEGREEKELVELISNLTARKYRDVQNQSLMEDLAGAEPKGQVSLAINDDYLNKWGLHYLPSYCNAHSRQICNSFKDAGPLEYGSKSPLSMACRDRLDGVLDSLPAPEPTPTPHSRSRHHAAGAGPRPGIATRRYRDVDGVCFAGSIPVELASGRRVPIRKLRRSIRVRTPLGPRKVVLVLKTAVQGGALPGRVASGDAVAPHLPRRQVVDFFGARGAGDGKLCRERLLCHARA